MRNKEEMTDWADDIAKGLVIMDDWRDESNGLARSDEVAVALRKAKADGIRETIILANSCKNRVPTQAELGPRLHFDPANNLVDKVICLCQIEANRIERGEQQP